jgi:protein TonB
MPPAAPAGPGPDDTPSPEAPDPAAAEPPLPPPPPAPPPMPALRLTAGLAALPAMRGTPAAPPGLSRGPQARDPGCGGAFTYPEAARRLGAEGTVLLRLSVGADGRVASAEVVQGSGFPVLDRAAREAALRCRFDPALEAGRPVPGSAPWRVTYRIAP